MKKSLVLILLFVSLSIAQEKYFIYFKDKGIESTNRLNKTSSLFKEAEKELSPLAIERRKQVMGENYITFEDLPIKQSYIDSISSLGISIENKLKWFNAVSCYLTEEKIKIISSFPFIEKIEKVRKYSAPNPTQEINKSISVEKINSSTGLDYGYSLTQNNLSEIPAVHDLGITGAGVLVGVLDTGFRWKTHPALKNLKIIAEKDFVQKDDITENQAGDASSQDSHGTAVLSLMAGYDPGKLIGPAFGANIILAKTENVSSETKVEEDNYAAALEWMEAQGVQITTSSLGYNEFDNPVDNYTFANMNGNTTIVAKAANLAFQRGVSTFTAAGNERGNSWGKIISPADAFDIIAVGAVNSSNQIASFSSPGPTSDGRIKPEIVAMGVSDYHAVTSGSYGSGSGTSYATPIAAGVAVLLKSTWPHLTNQQIRKIFLASGDNVATPNNDRGYGLISAKRAVSYPNLQNVNNAIRLNKIFINQNGVNSATIYFNINNGFYQSASMNQLNSFKYYYDFANVSQNTKIEFYFTYVTNNSNVIREPSSGAFQFTVGNSDIVTNINQVAELPSSFELYQNYPNPFNPETTISYSIPEVMTLQAQHNNSDVTLSQSKSDLHVTLKVYDILGREVATLVNEFQKPGFYKYQFSIINYQLSSGVYFYQLKAGDFVDTKKLMVLK